jgi:hypothetical protein
LLAEGNNVETLVDLQMRLGVRDETYRDGLDIMVMLIMRGVLMLMFVPTLV